MNDQLDRDFSESVDMLTTMIMPNGTEAQRLQLERALAEFARTVMLQTIQHQGRVPSANI